MSLRRTSIVIAAAALLSAVASGACAAEKSRPMDFTVKSEPITAVSPNFGQTTRLDTSKGRFGFTLNVQQFADRPVAPNDVQAGAYFRITPSLRVGGSVALGQQELAPHGNTARPADQPRVRLESTFKF